MEQPIAEEQSRLLFTLLCCAEVQRLFEQQSKKKTQIGKAYAAEEKENLAGKQSVRQSNLVNERGIKKKKQKKERTEEKNKHK